ncbi:MAG: hypothetical protein ABI551_06090, partial [Polyangiaceae bacterium]
MVALGWVMAGCGTSAAPPSGSTFHLVEDAGAGVGARAVRLGSYTLSTGNTPIKRLDLESDSAVVWWLGSYGATYFTANEIARQDDTLTLTIADLHITYAFPLLPDGSFAGTFTVDEQGLGTSGTIAPDTSAPTASVSAPSPFPWHGFGVRISEPIDPAFAPQASSFAMGS